LGKARAPSNPERVQSCAKRIFSGSFRGGRRSFKWSIKPPTFRLNTKNNRPYLRHKRIRHASQGGASRRCRFDRRSMAALASKRIFDWAVGFSRRKSRPELNTNCRTGHLCQSACESKRWRSESNTQWTSFTSHNSRLSECPMSSWGSIMAASASRSS
jgi:hypothetical protein